MSVAFDAFSYILDEINKDVLNRIELALKGNLAKDLLMKGIDIAIVEAYIQGAHDCSKGRAELRIGIERVKAGI